MKFRARLLASFVGVSLLVTLIFGLTAYRIADHSGLERETRLLQRTIAQMAATLGPGPGNVDRAHSGFAASADKNLFLFVLRDQRLQDEARASPLAHDVLVRIDQQIAGGETAGNVRSDKDAVVWAAAGVAGGSARLVGLYRSASVFVAPMQTLGIRLAVAAITTIWITIWAGLILTGGLMKRLESQRDALMHHALYDDLTELPNRRLLFDRLGQAISLARRVDSAVALLVIDLNDFKAINEALGHQSGDLLLRHVGTLLRTTFRGSDTVARLGSDEFALLLPETQLRQAIACAGKAIKALESPLVVNGITVRGEPSIGIAVYPNHGDNAEDLLRRADVAMNKAKQEKTGYVVYEPDADAQSLQRLSLLGELRNALDGGGLCLYYQPKLRLRDNRVIGVETLLRWPHPSRGFVPPDQFIPIAERTGLIVALTPWVLEKAFKQAAEWKEAGNDFSVAINISARNLHERTLPQQVMHLLDAWGLDAPHITLELTESAMMLDPTHAMNMLNALSRLGVKLSIDDFGTGYSSLAYLEQLPVSEIKIDKSFVMEMNQQERNRSIVRATIDLAHTLGLEVVAEGVEDAMTVHTLREFGCDYAQGYHIARPLPVAEFHEWLRRVTAAGDAEVG